MGDVDSSVTPKHAKSVERTFLPSNRSLSYFGAVWSGQAQNVALFGGLSSLGRPPRPKRPCHPRELMKNQSPFPVCFNSSLSRPCTPKKKNERQVYASPASGSVCLSRPARPHHLVELRRNAPVCVRPLHRGHGRHAQLVHVHHHGLRIDGRRRHLRGEKDDRQETL